MFPIGQGWPNPTQQTHGQGAATQVAFWKSASALASDPAFVYDNVNHRLVIGGATLTQVPYPTFTASVMSTRSAIFANHDSGFSAVSWSATGSSSSFFNGISARGTASAPAKSLAGDVMFRAAGRSYYDDGAGSKGYSNEVAQIRFVTAEDFSSGFAWGAYVAIFATQPTTTTLVDAFDVYWDHVNILGKSFKLDAAIEIDTTGAIATNVLQYNGTKWVPAAGGGGTITGAGAANQVAYWSGASALTSGAALTWDTHTLAIAPTPLAGGATALSVTGGAHTAIVGEMVSVLFDLSAVKTFTHGSAPAMQRAVRFIAPVYTTSTLTDTLAQAATVSISGAPTSTGGLTITNAYALQVLAGNVLLAGGLNVGAATGAVAGQVYTKGAPAWSGSNLGANVVIDGARNNAIAFLDSTSANPWAVFASGATGLKFATAPALSNTTTAMTVMLAIGQGTNPVSITNGLNVGTATGAVVGQIRALTTNILALDASGSDPTSGTVARLNSNVSGRDATLQFSDGVTYNLSVGVEGATGDFVVWDARYPAAAGTERFRVTHGAGTAKLTGGLNLGTTITNYNGVATVSNGVGAIVATASATGVGAITATATLYAVPAAGAGRYRITFYAKVTTRDATGSRLGPVTIGWTDAVDSVAMAIQVFAQGASGWSGLGDTSNTTASYQIGSIVVRAKASTNITYSIDYASTAAGTMKYEDWLQVEYLG